MSAATPPGDGPEEARDGDEQSPPDAQHGGGAAAAEPTPPPPGASPVPAADEDAPSDAAPPAAEVPTAGRAGDQAGVDVDAAWAQIMAHWNEPAVDPGTRSPARPGRHRRLDGHAAPGASAGPETPPQELRRRRTDGPPAPAPAPQPARSEEPRRPSAPDGRGGVERDPLAEEHYVPPEPPPLPRAGWRTWLPWVGVLGVPVFFLAVVVFRPSLPSEVVLVAVLGFVAGFLTLVLRLPNHRDDDGDDGARV